MRLLIVIPPHLQHCPAVEAIRLASAGQALELEFQWPVQLEDMIDLAFDKLAGHYDKALFACDAEASPQLASLWQSIGSEHWALMSKLCEFEILLIQTESLALPFAQLIFPFDASSNEQGLLQFLQYGQRQLGSTPAADSLQMPDDAVLQKLLQELRLKTPVDSKVLATRLSLPHQTVVQAIQLLTKKHTMEVASYKGGSLWMVWSISD